MGWSALGHCSDRLPLAARDEEPHAGNVGSQKRIGAVSPCQVNVPSGGGDTRGGIGSPG